MSLSRIEKYISIMLDIYSTGTTTRTQIVKKYNIPYSSIVTIFKEWVKTGFIVKNKINDFKAGEDQYNYKITDKGIDYLKGLSAKFGDVIKGKPTYKELENIIDDFYTQFPNLVRDSEFDIYDNNIMKLIKNIKKYFKEKHGIHFKK